MARTGPGIQKKGLILMLEHMRSVDSADGTRIAWQRSGTGPPLVLVHGSVNDHTSWEPLLPALEEHFTIYALDRRGHGESDPVDSATYAIEREFEDVAAVIDAVGEPAAVLGHSYGALCALEAAHKTDNITKLVLYEPPIPVGTAGWPAHSLPEIEALLAAGDREGTVLTFAREVAQLAEEEIAGVRATPAWQTVLDTAPTIPYEVRAIEGYACDLERLRHLQTPTLMLMGTRSSPFLQEASESVAAALLACEQAVLTGQGHLAMYTDPERFLSTVIQFLTNA